jgi:hypothetical protein
VGVDLHPSRVRLSELLLHARHVRPLFKQVRRGPVPPISTSGPRPNAPLVQAEPRTISEKQRVIRCAGAIALTVVDQRLGDRRPMAVYSLLPNKRDS